MPVPELRHVAVLVTGGAGFIGSHLVDALVDRGARVRVLDDFSTGRRRNLAPGRERVELLTGDVRDLDACRRACRGVELVFHQAALGSVPRSLADPAASIAVNAAGTANVLAAARDAGARRVVYASSSSVYGDSPRQLRREGEEGEPLSPYAESKRMTEQLARTFHRCLGLESIGLRYFNVFGPRQDADGPYAAVVPRFFQACLDGTPPTVFGDGYQSRDFTFVSDAVAANLLAAGAPAAAADGRALNVAAGRAATVLELLAAIQESVGSRLAPGFEPPRPGDVPHSVADLTQCRSLLGYEPEVALERGLEACREHYHSTLAASGARAPGPGGEIPETR